MHFVYIVRCRDGTLYTGYTRNPEARVEVHNAGRGARYTSGRRPVCLVYSECLPSRGAALQREHAVKRLTRAGKEALILPAEPQSHRSTHHDPVFRSRSVSRR